MNKRGFFLFAFTIIVIYLFITAYFEMVVYPKGSDTDYASIGQKGFSLLELDVEMQAQTYFIEQTAQVVFVQTLGEFLSSCGFNCQALDSCLWNEQLFLTDVQKAFLKNFNTRLSPLKLEDTYDVKVSLKDSLVSLEIKSKKPLQRGIKHFDYRLDHHYSYTSTLSYEYLKTTVLMLQSFPTCTPALPSCEIKDDILTLKGFFKHPVLHSDFVCPISVTSTLKQPLF